MHAIALERVPGVLDLDARGQETTGSGLPLGPIAIGVGVYLAKTVGDHWGDFKEGVSDGLDAVWGQ